MGSEPFRRLMFLGTIFCAPIIAVAQHFDNSLEVLPAGSSLQSASYHVPGAEATSGTGRCNACGCAACSEGRSASWFDWGSFDGGDSCTTDCGRCSACEQHGKCSRGTDCTDGHPQFRIWVDAMFLSISDPRTRDLVLQGPRDLGLLTDLSRTALSTSDLSLGRQTTPRIGVESYFTPIDAVQFVWFGDSGWNDQQSVFGIRNLHAPGTLGWRPAFANNDRFDVAYAAALQNAEFNLVHDVDVPGLSGLIGFRYFSFDEKFGMSAHRRETVFSLGGDIAANTYNDFYGAQTGLRYLQELDRVWWEVTGKVGIYSRSAQQRTTVWGVVDPIIIRDFQSNGQDTAFIGELGFNLLFPVNDWLRVRGGYNLFWITNVARAPDQLPQAFDPLSGPALRDHAAVFMHGANLGLEIGW